MREIKNRVESSAPSLFHPLISSDPPTPFFDFDKVKTRVTSLLESDLKLRPLLGAFLIPLALPVVLIPG